MECLVPDLEKNRIGVHRDDCTVGKASQNPDGQRSGARPEFDHPEGSLEVGNNDPEYRLRSLGAGRVDGLGEHWVPPLEETFA